MRTEAAVLYETGSDLRIEELEIPPLRTGQVLVRLAFSGICHTQLGEVRGKRGEDKWLPHVLGHEGSGVVEEIGPGVSKVAPGDAVVLTWITAHGLPADPIQYRGVESGRTVNSGPIATFGRHMIVAEQKLVPLPNPIALDTAALLGCAIPTGAGVVRNTFQARPDHSLVVLGAGGVGLSAILGAAMLGVNPIIAVDIVPDKLAMAAQLGATHTIDARRCDVRQAVLEATGGRGADFALEAAGVVETMELGLEIVRKGGIFAIAGNLPKGHTIRIDPFELIAGKRILGTWGGETQPDADVAFYVDRIRAGALDAQQLISHRFALRQVNEALALLEQGAVSRALLDFSV